MQPYMPFTANLAAVLFILAVSLVVLDLLLVRWFRLGKVAWKKVDYIWLAFTALGLVGAAAHVRMEVASGQLDMYEKRALTAFEALRSLLESASSSPGYICRTFTRSEFSPPPEEFQSRQNEYNIACEWLKKMSEAVNAHPASPVQPIDRASLPRPPRVSDDALIDVFHGIDHQFDYFDSDIKALEELRQKSKRSPLEEILGLVGPFLLAIALALRITKVTGEIKLESS